LKSSLKVKLATRVMLMLALLAVALVKGVHWSIVLAVAVLMFGQEMDAIVVANLINALLDRVRDRRL